MTNLIIDGKPAYIPADLEFSLKLDNPYFTKSSSHSLEVELPAAQNQHIFGIINRLDSTVSKDMLPCELICNGIIMLQGKAGILEVTEKAVKVQLVAGLSEFNFANRKDIFLDETEWGEVPLLDKIEGFEFVPVFHDNTQVIYPILYKDGTSATDLFNHAQIYLWKLFEMVMMYFGFSIGESVLHNSWLKNLVCIGAYREPFLEWHGTLSEEWRALPHWPVKDLLTEIEKLTGSVIYIDERKREANVIGLNDYFSRKSIALQEIVDEYECSMQEEDNDNYTVGNMSYQLPTETDDGYARLKREVFSSAEKKKFNSFAELKTDWESDSPDNRIKYIYIAQDRHYITKDGNLTEVDIMGDLIRDAHEEKTNTNFKMVPVKLEERECVIYEKNLAGSNSKIGQVKMMIPSVYMISSPATAKIKNVQEAIEGKEVIEQAKEKDTMEISLCTIQSYDMPGTAIRSIALFNDYKTKSSAQTGQNEEMSLCLRNVCNKSIGNIQKTINRICSDMTYNISFLYKGLPDVRDVFLMRNQKYVAKTIKVRINAQGFETIMEGEFYKI